MELKHVIKDPNRHGKMRYYYKRDGVKTRLPDDPNDPAFLQAYLALHVGGQKPEAKVAGRLIPYNAEADRPVGKIMKGTLRDLCRQLYDSKFFKSLGDGTQYQRQHYLDDLCDSVPAGQDRPRGDRLFADLEYQHVQAIMEEMQDDPTRANAWLLHLSAMYGWARRKNLVKANPCSGVRYLRPVKSGGHHTWTDDERAQFEAFYPVGTFQRLVYALVFYTGVRRCDLVRLAPPKNGVFSFTEKKNGAVRVVGGHRKSPAPKFREVPVAPALQQIIDATLAQTAVVDLAMRKAQKTTLLVCKGGVHGGNKSDWVWGPYHVKTLNTHFAKWVKAAGLPAKCTPHGIRKAGATYLALNNGTLHQIKEYGGWSTFTQPMLYTEAANKLLLTAQAVSIFPADPDALKKTATR